MPLKHLPTYKKLFLTLFVLFIPFITVLIPEAIRFGLMNWMFYEYILIRSNMWIWSYLVFLLLFLALFVLTGSLPFSSGFLLVLSLIFGVANLNTLTYRSMPFMPSDIYQAKDAAIAVNSGFLSLRAKVFGC
ncbi:MAG: hypothetical protein IJ091_05445 [Oscillospiraceae bacterium]|nr:hypothetical protein [Oscillospiraceae bacterium]